ncbi:hypothetical protein [Rhodohalobacter sp. 8-1]|uniref:hypothetical protein n=1 Tax=Rhodohalobacter sp. 8-1 TaxID=3131972 RepID=UPI0030ED4CF0
MKKLTKKEAIQLLPLIVDNEASEEDKIAFFKYIQTDPKVKKKYESLLFVKQLLKTKYSRESAPDRLKKKISGIIEDMEWEKEQESKVDNSTTNLGNSGSFNANKFENQSKDSSSPLLKLLKPARYLAAASVIFIFSLLTIELLEKMSGERLYNQQSVERVALNHFTTGSHIEASLASYQPASLDHASQLLQERMAYSPRLPKIKGASLRSIVQTTFFDGHTIPVFEFYQSGIDETIHIFAFKMGEFDDPGMVVRDPEAVKSCKGYDDFHIKEINGKHVVSWKWGDYWYTAVSNHNGTDLIALVEPTLSEDEQKTRNSSW